jgi:hypothetical protein
LLGKQPLAVGVDHDRMVVFLAGIHTGPELLHRRLLGLVCINPRQMTSPSGPYTAIIRGSQ